METRQLKISTEVDQLLHTAARQSGLSKKSYAEEAIRFFARNGIDPKTYSPGREFDQLQLIRKSTERIIGVFRQQEQEVFGGLMAELLRNQVAIQALINLLLDYAVQPDQQAVVARRIQDYIDQRMAQLSPVSSEETPTVKS